MWADNKAYPFYKIIVKAQYTVQDSAADAMQYEINVRDTKELLKLGMTKTPSKMVKSEKMTLTLIEFIFLIQKKATTISNGKIFKKTLKYTISPESGAIAYLEILDIRKSQILIALCS